MNEKRHNETAATIRNENIQSQAYSCRSHTHTHEIATI